MNNNFFALISRMRYIERWSLMRSSVKENVQEHSHMVAVIAHALGLISRDVFGQACDPNKLAAIALYHDASEILTGDLPTPIKYHNANIKTAYAEVESIACQKLLTTLPQELRPEIASLLNAEANGLEYELVRAADKFSAYIKCIEERKAGNNDFLSAEASTLEKLKSLNRKEVHYFLEHFIPAFEKNLDELGTIED